MRKSMDVRVSTKSVIGRGCRAGWLAYGTHNPNEQFQCRQYYDGTRVPCQVCICRVKELKGEICPNCPYCRREEAPTKQTGHDDLLLPR